MINIHYSLSPVFWNPVMSAEVRKKQHLKEVLPLPVMTSNVNSFPNFWNCQTLIDYAEITREVFASLWNNINHFFISALWWIKSGYSVLLKTHKAWFWTTTQYMFFSCSTVLDCTPCSLNFSKASLSSSVSFLFE